MNEKALRQVASLLRLAKSDNANEAASAAAAAQKIMAENSLTEAMLDSSDEPIQDFGKKGAPLDESPRRTQWRIRLAVDISVVNATRCYLRGAQIHLVGRASDVDTVRYLFAYLTKEVERLCDRDGKGCGQTWRNNFRLGVVETVGERMKVAVAEVAASARSSAGETGLVRVEAGLARLEDRSRSVAVWMKQNLRMRKGGGGSHARGDESARAAGRAAGQEVGLNRGGPALGRGALQLN